MELFLSLTFIVLGGSLASAETECGFIPTEDHALFGRNDHVIRGSDLAACKEACLQSLDFPCLSFDYVRASGSCYLSASSAATNPEDFGVHGGSDYYEHSCDIPVTSPGPTRVPGEECEELNAAVVEAYDVFVELAASRDDLGYALDSVNGYLQYELNVDPDNAEDVKQLVCRIADIKTIRSLADMFGVKHSYMRRAYSDMMKVKNGLGDQENTRYLLGLINDLNLCYARLEIFSNGLPVNLTRTEVLAITSEFIEKHGDDFIKRLGQFAKAAGEPIDIDDIVDAENLANGLLAPGLYDFPASSGTSRNAGYLLRGLDLRYDAEFESTYMRALEAVLSLLEVVKKLPLADLD